LGGSESCGHENANDKGDPERSRYAVILPIFC
jgi:hypothetical protein